MSLPDFAYAIFVTVLFLLLLQLSARTAYEGLFFPFQAPSLLLTSARWQFVQDLFPLLLTYLIITLIYGFVGGSVAAHLSAANTKIYIFTSAFLGILFAASVRILASNQEFADVLKGLYYQLIAAVGVIVLFGKPIGPTKLGVLDLFVRSTLAMRELGSEGLVISITLFLVLTVILTEGLLYVFRS